MLDWIKKNKTNIIIVLTGIASIIGSLFVTEGTDKIVSSIIIAIITVAISALKEGITEGTIELLAKAIKMIIDAINEKKKLDEDEDKTVIKSSRIFSLSEEEIIEILKK